MATVTQRATIASTANASTYASGSFTPVAGERLVLLVAGSATVAAGSATASANGITFTRHATALRASIDTSYVFVANQDVPASPVAMTVTFDCTGDAATGALGVVFGVSGVTGHRNSKGGSQAAGVMPACAAWGTSTAAGNPILAFVHNVGVGGTQMTGDPTGFTRLPATDLTYTTPDRSGRWVVDADGVVQTQFTWGTGNTSPTASAVVAVELTAASSGTNHTENPIDAEALSDAAVASQGHIQKPSDQEALTDSAVPAQVHVAIPTDVLGLADSATVDLAVAGDNWVENPTDVEGLADTATLVQGHGATATDTEGLADTAAVSQGHASRPADQEALADSAQVAQTHPIAATDSAGLGDLAVARQTHTTAPSDQMGVTDTATVVVFRNIPITAGDSTGLADTSSASMELVKTVSDQLGVADTITASQGHGRSTADVLAATDSVVVSRGLGSSPFDSMGITDTTSISWVIATVLQDALGLSDSATAQLGLLLSQNSVDSLGITDATVRAMGLATRPADLAGLVDSARIQAAISLAQLDTLTLDDLASVGLEMPTLLGDPLGLSDDVDILMFGGVLPAVNPAARLGSMGNRTARLGEMRGGGVGTVVEHGGADRIVDSNRTGELQ